MKTQWTTKEEYLQFVRDWKAVYKDLTWAIRDSRRGARELLARKRQADPEAQLSLEDHVAREAARRKVYDRLSAVTGVSFRDPSATATYLLAVRRDEKVRAGLAMMAARDAFAV